MNGAQQNFLDDFARSVLPGADLAWLGAQRAAGMAALARHDLPHRRVEAWRYTDLRQALNRADLTPAQPHAGAVILPAAAARPGAHLFAAIDRHAMVFVNGFFRPDLSDLADLPAGIEIHALGAALDANVAWLEPVLGRIADRPDEAVIGLNTGLMRDGAAIRLSAGSKLAKPLHLVFLTTDGNPAAAHTRNLVVAEANAGATLFESHIGLGEQAYLADIVTEIALAEGAHLAHVKLQDEGENAVHVASVAARLDARARFDSLTLAMGAALARHQSFVAFAGEGAHATINAAYALRRDQLSDVTAIVDHAVPACTSEALVKGVLDDRATGVFQGKVIVREDAQGSDGRQMSNALLLSRDAAMNAKPELEIYADDVQCAHGSTIGELDRDALFYLRSRGIDEATARALLISAFLDQALDSAPHDAARAALKELVGGWFADRGGKERR